MRKRMVRRKMALKKDSGWRGTRKSRHGSARIRASHERRLVLRNAQRKAVAPCQVINGGNDLGVAVLAALSPSQKGRLVEMLTF